MKKLSAPSFRRARDFLLTQARPLERALFAHEFEAGPRGAVLEALAPFQNADGGYGHALEPDVRLPASSAIATLTGLDVLREIAAGSEELPVRRALAWVVQEYDAALPGWRSVPPAVDDFAHARHWSWDRHAPGAAWPHLLVPGARLLSHLQHWRALAPPELVADAGVALRAHVETLTPPVFGDGLHYASTVDEPRLRTKLCRLALESVNTNPAEWGGYVNKPLKLAPLPESPFADVLAGPVSTNLDYEIEQQPSDGGWEPNWSWQGAYEAEWQVARREWRGELTLKTLRSLRAYGRIEGL
ncbi:MAG: hypothetical protein WEF50_00230 [Myxococcota bacterium]